jgi:hypothetical protein
VAIKVKQLRKWLGTLDDNELVCVDDGGLILESVRKPEIYIEVGGEPDEWGEEEGEYPWAGFPD